MAKKEKIQEPTEALMTVVALIGVISLLLFGSILINFLQGNEKELVEQGSVTKLGTVPGSALPWILVAMCGGSCFWIYESVKKIGKIRDKKNKRKTKSKLNWFNH